MVQLCYNPFNNRSSDPQVVISLLNRITSKSGGNRRTAFDYLCLLSNQEWVPSFPSTLASKQEPYIIGSLGPKALKYESFDAKGINKAPEGSRKIEPAKKGISLRVSQPI